MPRVRARVRGIYATAITERLRDTVTIVDPSDPIADRFNGRFGDGMPTVEIEDAPDRQGVGITGQLDGVATVRRRLEPVARDVLAWTDPAPRGAVFDAVVTETLGRGAVVDLGPREGFLAYNDVGDWIEAGDELDVQVRTPTPPWVDRRPEVTTELEATAWLVTLVRGGSGPDVAIEDPDRAIELVRSLDLLEADVPDGWGVRFEKPAARASLEQLDEALALATERADAMLSISNQEGILASTVWVWFGRESRVALDDIRRAVAATISGHHRIKAATPDASAAVDFAEALCAPADGGEFPFDVVVDHFGPHVGDELALSHGKPDGRRFSLGTGRVTAIEGETVTLRREMTPGGRYDGLDVPRESGDIAVTRLTEGRWWYPTVYRDSQGGLKGTYVNICTPVELFPRAASYLDLEIDVVKHADGSVERLDDDVLDEAVEHANLPESLAAKAREVAASIERGLSA